jgi:peptide/nickel transport system permease protein
VATLSPIAPLERQEDIRFEPITPNQLIWRRFKHHRGAMFGLVGVCCIITFIVLCSILVPYEQSTRPDVVNKLSAPSASHYFGTDTTGRDVFARIVFGGQISLAVAVLSLVLGSFMGILIGGVAGYFGGWVDSILMRFTEAMLSIPSLFLLIVLGKLLGNKIPNVEFFGRNISGSVLIVIVVIGLTSWMYEARIIRANILSLRERDYVSASRAMGVGNARIIFRHLIPNTIAPIIVSATLGLVNAITSEAYVSFLGLGVQDPPTASWGNMISQALNLMQRNPPVWWMWFFPSAFITFTVLCVNFVGDGLRDAFDPRK